MTACTANWSESEGVSHLSSAVVSVSVAPLVMNSVGGSGPSVAHAVGSAVGNWWTWCGNESKCP